MTPVYVRHDSFICDPVYMWSSWLIYWHRDSFLVMSYINMSYKVTSPGDLSKRCSRVTHSTQHMNESRTLYDIWTSHELHISMGHELPCSSLLALQSCHALHTTYEWVTNSTQHTNESRTPCINDYEWVTNFTWQMNESHTPVSWFTNYLTLMFQAHPSISRTPNQIWISHELHI